MSYESSPQDGHHHWRVFSVGSPGSSSEMRSVDYRRQTHRPPGTGYYVHQYGSQSQQAAAYDQSGIDSISVRDDDVEENCDDNADHVLSPTDGYFRGSQQQLPTTAASSRVPHIPDVWVQDPSLEEEGRAASIAGNGKAPEEARSWSRPSPAPCRSNTPCSTQMPHHLLHLGSSASHIQSFREDGMTTSPTTTPCQQPLLVHNGSSNRASHSRPFIPSDAPPAYSPRHHGTRSSTSQTSPFNPSLHQPSTLIQNYQTFGHTRGAASMGGEESAGLLGRHPESMGADGEYEDDTLMRRHRVRRRLPSLGWRCGRGLFFSIAVLVVMLLLLLGPSSFGGDKDQKEALDGNPPPANKAPSSKADNIMDFPVASHCLDAQFEDTNSFSFKAEAGRSLSIVQTVERTEPPRPYTNVLVHGAIKFRKAEGGSPPTITVETKKNDKRIKISHEFDSDTQRLVLTVPRGIPWEDQQQSPCLAVRITVAVPEGSVLGDLSAEAIHLAVLLINDLSMALTGKATIGTTVGRVVAATNEGGEDNNEMDRLVKGGAPASFRFDSRTISIKTISASIQGSWPLYDYLGLETTSGNIKAGVEPKHASKDKPRAATLLVKSMSGNVEVWEPVHKLSESLKNARSTEEADSLIPARSYAVDVHTTSGDVMGALAFTSSAKFHSTSGTLAVDLLPVLPSNWSKADGAKDAKCSLETSSTSGTTVVRVLEPVWSGWDDGAVYTAGAALAAKIPLHVLKARHTATSAEIGVRYPASWEGGIEASALAARITVSGDGVKIIQSGGDWPGVNNKVIAQKGDLAQGEGSFILVHSTSGTIGVHVGDGQS